MKQAVIFGAGSIGRGFVGALLCGAEWRVTFVDVVESLVERLNVDGGYNQVIVGTDGERTVRVAPVDALPLHDRGRVVEALERADLVATAVGSANLPPAASLIADAAVQRARSGSPPLDVLLCENLHDAPAVVREMIATSHGALVAESVGLIATSIGRMVPVPIPNPDDPTAIRVEPYSFLPYDASALVGPVLDVPGLVPIADGFDLYGDRKLYVHNMGHCMLAYLADLRGYTYTWQAVEDVDLRYLVRNAMVESATALTQRYGASGGDLLQHVDDLLVRFGNRALADTAERVGRDPVRKMGADDRLLGSYSRCLDMGVVPVHVSLAVALGAQRLTREDGWDQERVLKWIDVHLFTRQEAPLLRQLLLDQIMELAEGRDISALIRGIDGFYLPSRIA